MTRFEKKQKVLVMIVTVCVILAVASIIAFLYYESLWFLGGAFAIGITGMLLQIKHDNNKMLFYQGDIKNK